MYGYRQGLRRGNLWVLFDGNADMGIHVLASGQGCGQLVDEEIVTDFPQFLGELLTRGVQFTRVDVALDDRTGVLSMERMRACAQRGQFVSRWRRVQGLWDRERTRDGCRLAGLSLVWGSKHSNGRLHIYDKALKEGFGGPWVRVELQLHKERAQLLAQAIAEQGLGVVPGVLRSYLVFTQRGRHSQRERWPIQPWWKQFLADSQKVQLVASDRKEPDDLAWLCRTAAPALARVRAQYGDAVIAAILAHGESRIH
jgi:phage replication initiation protein